MALGDHRVGARLLGREGLLEPAGHHQGLQPGPMDGFDEGAERLGGEVRKDYGVERLAAGGEDALEDLSVVDQGSGTSAAERTQAPQLRQPDLTVEPELEANYA